MRMTVMLIPVVESTIVGCFEEPILLRPGGVPREEVERVLGRTLVQPPPDPDVHPHHRLAQATTMVQIAISLAAITVLTRRLWLFWGAIGAAAIGGVLFVLAVAAR